MTETRKNIMLGTAGHVDHGKTALVKLLTGCDTDRLSEEKQRGLTIELGFAPCRMRDERIVGIVDVPGHVSFIRNMVAGAHGVDVVILVVAADDGVMPQTREHLDILTLMGVRRGLVALTKIDMVDEEVRRLAADDVREFVGGTFLEGAPICPISNITGEGFEGFFAAMNEAVAACEQRPDEGLFRLWIERGFGIKGFGTVASGIPTSGQIHKGDRLRLLPGGQTGRVRGLEVYGEPSDVARAGECVAVNLADIAAENIDRGKVLCASETLEAVHMFEADLHLLGSVPRPLADYAEVHLHVGTGEAMAHVAMLEGRPLESGESQLVQMRLVQPLPVAPGERFVIRAGMAKLAGGTVTTLGGGRVLSATNIRLRRNRPWTLASLTARRDALDSPPDWCGAVLKEAGEAISAAELAGRAQMPASRVGELLETLTADGVAMRVASSGFVHRDVVTDAADRIRDSLTSFHDANPTRLGMGAGELTKAIEAPRGVFDLALAQLEAAGAVERAEKVIALAGRGLKLSDEDAALCEQIESTLREAHLAPPLPADLAGALRVTPDRLDKMVRLLGDRGRALRLDEKVIMHADAVEAARQVALDLFRAAGAFTTMDFREALGVSRKFAVPLLDYFDTVRWTVRSGNRRTPGAAAKELL